MNKASADPKRLDTTVQDSAPTTDLEELTGAEEPAMSGQQCRV